MRLTCYFVPKVIRAIDKIHLDDGSRKSKSSSNRLTINEGQDIPWFVDEIGGLEEKYSILGFASNQIKSKVA